MAETEALAECVRLWMPGLRSDPMMVAGQIQRQLLKRGFKLVPAALPNHTPDCIITHLRDTADALEGKT